MCQCAMHHCVLINAHIAFVDAHDHAQYHVRVLVRVFVRVTAYDASEHSY